MTECISSTCSLFNTPYKRFRRLSITQGTISSRAKDVRSNDPSAASLLKKKNSTSQLSIKTIQPKKTPRPQDIRPLKTMNKSVSNFNSPSVRLRLDDKKNKNGTPKTEKQGSLYFQSVKKAEYDSEKTLAENRLEPAHLSLSGSTRVPSEPSSFKGTQTTPETSNTPLDSFAQPLSADRQLHETIFQDLMVGIRVYTNQIQELSHTMLSSLSSDSSDTLNQERPKTKSYTTHIQTCKGLIAQQQTLLTQLEDTTKEKPIYPALRSKPSQGWLQQLKTTVLNTNTSNCQDKTKTDTTVSIQGICETADASLVPAKLLPKEKKEKYVFKYKLDLTEYDRRHTFVLAPEDQWQKDELAKKCQLESCSIKFGLFQRKHHCRRCGAVYCNTHSLNKLPLFSPKNLKQAILSRTCDSCCFQLTEKNLFVQ